MIQDIKDYLTTLDPVHRWAFYISAMFLGLGLIVLLVLYPVIAGGILISVAIFLALVIIIATVYNFWWENF